MPDDQPKYVADTHYRYIFLKELWKKNWNENNHLYFEAARIFHPLVYSQPIE